MPARIAIVGAGLSGLIAARDLHDAGHDVRLFDKARGPGGRMATRRREGHAFDIGAQFFTVRDARMQPHVRRWERDGVVARWSPRMAVLDAEGVRDSPDEQVRWVGTPRMSALTRHLAEGLDLRLATRVVSIERDGEGWRLGAEEDLGAFDAALVTTPPEQAVPLLAGAPALQRTASRVVSSACWAATLVFDEAPAVAFDAAFVKHGPLAWVAREASKPGRAPEAAWVLHASEAWSKAHLEEPADAVARQLAEAFAAAAGCALPRVTYADAHRWALATAAQPLGAGAVWDGLLRIGMCGDWCASLRVEGAVLSGLDAAQRMQADLATL